MLASSIHAPIPLYAGRISTLYYTFIGAVTTLSTGFAASLLFAPPPLTSIRWLTRRSLPEPEATAVVGT